VRSQQCEIDGTNPTLPAESNQPGVEVEVKVEDEKCGRADKGGNHSNAMSHDLMLAYEKVAEKKKGGRGAIQGSIDGRKRCERNHSGR
jgi:hypothetical protein